MDTLERKRAKQINEALAATTIMGVMLLFVGMTDYFVSTGPVANQTVLFLPLICLIAYCAWYFIEKYQTNLADPKPRDYIIVGLVVAAETALLLSTGAQESKLKPMLIIPIALATIRYGKFMGFFVAALSAVGAAATDVLALPGQSYNPYLQADLLLIGIFFIISWVIGNLVETEKDIRSFLIEMANMDELTGLYNHRSFQELLSAALDRVGAAGQKLSLVMFDVDYFKHYNDIYGHQRGDAVLQAIARIVRQHSRAQDSVARYGGEEFALIMPDTESAAAVVVAEAIRRDIEAQPFYGVQEQPGGKLTISAGIATYPDNAQTKEELIRMADMALYQAKYTSKNKVELYFSVLDSLKKDLDQNELSLLNTIKTLVNVINAKDRYTFGHSGRVLNYAQSIGRAYGLGEDELKTLRYSAFLHDVGKIEISREVLNKHEPLTEDEKNILKKHPEWGADIIRPVSALRDAVPIILHHHEWYNGEGYPAQIAGNRIPLGARLLSLADSLDAMSTDRPYKRRKSIPEIKAELRAYAGVQFDPALADIAIRLLDSGDLKLEQPSISDSDSPGK